MDSSHMIDKDDEDIKINDFVLHSEDLTQLLNDYDKYLHKYTESLLPRLQPSDNPHNPFGTRGQRARTLGRAVTNLPDATFVLIASNFGQLCKIDIQLGMLESFQRLASSFFCVHRGSTEELQRYYYALRNVKAGTGEDTRLHTLYNFLTASGIIKSNTIKEISLVSLFLEFFDFLEFDDFRQSLVFFASFDSNSSLGNDGCLVSPSPFVSCVVPVLFLIGFDPNVIPLIRSAFGPISQSLRLSSTPLIAPQRAQINANPAFSSSSSSSTSNSLLTQDMYPNDLLSPPLLQQQQQQQQPRPHQQLSSFSAGKYPQDLYGNDLLSPPLQQQQQPQQQRMDQQYDDGSWDGSLFGQNVVGDEGDCVNAVGNGAVIGPSFVYQQNCAYQTASSPQASLLRPTVQGGGLMQQQQQQRQMATMDMGNSGGAPFVIGNDDGAYDSVTIEDNTFGSPSTMGAAITATPGAIVQDDYYGTSAMDGAGIDYRKHTQQQQHGRHHHHHHNHTYVTVKTEKIDDYPSQNVSQAPEVPSSCGSYGYPLYYSVDSGKPQQIYYPDNAKLASSPSLTKPQVLSSLPPMAATTTGTAQAQTPQPVSLDYPQYFQSNIAIPTSAAPSVANTSTLSTSAPSTSTPALMLSMRQQKMNAVSSPPEAFATAANPVPTSSQPTNIMATQHSIMQSKSTSNLHAKGRSKYSTKSHKQQQQQQGLMLGSTQPPPPPISLQSIPIKAETYDSLSASMANININSNSGATTTTNTTTTAATTTIPSVSPNNSATSINNNGISNSIGNGVSVSTSDNDSSNMFGKVSLHISKQPPSKTVYQRILKPYPTVMVCGLENTGLANLFVEAILLRADNEIDARSCMEGTVVVKVSNSFAVFKKLKILTTSQQQGTLFKLRFILKSYYGSDFRAIPNTETTSNTIEVFSHTLYLNHDRSQQQVNPPASTAASVTSPPTVSTSPSTSIVAGNGGSIQSMTSSTSSLPAVVSPSLTSSLSSPSSLPLNPLLRHSKQQNQNQNGAGGYYDVEKNGSPVVKMVIPQCCRAGERVVVIGSNFCNSGNTKVSFNDVSVVPSFHESGTLICTVPRLAFKSLDAVNQNEMQVSVRVSNDSITFSDSVFTIIYYNDQ